MALQAPIAVSLRSPSAEEYLMTIYPEYCVDHHGLMASHEIYPWGSLEGPSIKEDSKKY